MLRIIIFNWVAIVEVIIGFILSFVIGKFLNLFGFYGPASDHVSYICGFMLIFAGDLLLRIVSTRSARRKPYQILHPNMGGHIFIIPVFVVSLIWAGQEIYRLVSLG